MRLSVCLSARKHCPISMKLGAFIDTIHLSVHPSINLQIRSVKWSISLIVLIARLNFQSRINRGFNAHFVCHIFLFVCVRSAGRHRRPIAVGRKSTASTDDWLQWLISARHSTYWQLTMTESFDFIVRSTSRNVGLLNVCVHCWHCWFAYFFPALKFYIHPCSS